MPRSKVDIRTVGGSVELHDLLGVHVNDVARAALNREVGPRRDAAIVGRALERAGRRHEPIDGVDLGVVADRLQQIERHQPRGHFHRIGEQVVARLHDDVDARHLQGVGDHVDADTVGAGEDRNEQPGRRIGLDVRFVGVVELLGEVGVEGELHDLVDALRIEPDRISVQRFDGDQIVRGAESRNDVAAVVAGVGADPHLAGNRLDGEDVRAENRTAAETVDDLAGDPAERRGVGGLIRVEERRVRDIVGLGHPCVGDVVVEERPHHDVAHHRVRQPEGVTDLVQSDRLDVGAADAVDLPVLAGVEGDVAVEDRARGIGSLGNIRDRVAVEVAVGRVDHGIVREREREREAQHPGREDEVRIGEGDQIAAVDSGGRADRPARCCESGPRRRTCNRAWTSPGSPRCRRPRSTRRSAWRC